MTEKELTRLAVLRDDYEKSCLFGILCDAN